MPELEPEIAAHLHDDIDVTVERVRSFGKLGEDGQLKVLSELRATVADQSTAIEIAVIAVAISLVGFFIRPVDGIDVQGMNWIAAIVVLFLVGFFVVFVQFPTFAPQLRRNVRQQRAQVWLAAYEDEIQRRRSRRKK